MTSFYVACFISSFVYATLRISTVTSILELACYLLNKCACPSKNCQSTNFARLQGRSEASKVGGCRTILILPEIFNFNVTNLCNDYNKGFCD